MNFFKDKQGRVVVAQKPNRPLWLAMAFYGLYLISGGLLENLSLWGFRLVLLYWAYLEMAFGLSPFRRLLGLLVSGYILISFFW